MRPHGHFKVDSRRPIARAVCDRCGFVYNRTDLKFQYQWSGALLQNLRLLVCQRCMDVPQEQLRTIILPADPVPISNPRIEQTGLDNNPYSSLGTNIGTMTNYGGLAAAFDYNINKPLQFCAAAFPSAAGLTNWVGKYWGTSNSQIVTSYSLYAPNNSTFLGSTTSVYEFQGSDDASTWTTLDSGTTAGTVAEVITASPTSTTNYYYHRAIFTGDGVSVLYLAQLLIDVQGTSPQ